MKIRSMNSDWHSISMNREKRITIAERKNDMEKQALYDAYVESERLLDEIYVNFQLKMLLGLFQTGN